MTRTIRWEELLPHEFVARQEDLPLVYLPLGLCEPHGHAAAFGLDTFKAVWLCEQAARRFGGIVAPTQGYHIDETGYHRPWLAEVIGKANPHLGSVPPDVLLRMLLFQLWAFPRRLSCRRGAHRPPRQPGRPAIGGRGIHASRRVRIVTVSDPELVKGITW